MPASTQKPVGLIDISAVEYEARAARAAVMREAAVALPAVIARLVARLRAKSQALPQAQPRTNAYA